MHSARESIEEINKKASHGNCRTTGRKARAFLSSQEWSRCGTIFRHILSVFFRQSDPYPENPTKISDHPITRNSKATTRERDIVCATHHKVIVPNGHSGVIVVNLRELLRRRNRFRNRVQFRKWWGGISNEIWGADVSFRPGSFVPEARERLVGEDAHGRRKSKVQRVQEDRGVFTPRPLHNPMRGILIWALGSCHSKSGNQCTPNPVIRCLSLQVRPALARPRRRIFRWARW